MAILKPYIDSGRVRYLSWNVKTGPAAARNRGIKSSPGEFIAFLDADDIWFPDKLVKQTKLFNDPEVGMAFSDARFFGANFRFTKYSEMAGGLRRGMVVAQLLRRNFIPLSSVVVRRSALVQCGFFDEDLDKLRIGEDYELWLRLAPHVKFDFVAEALAGYRINPAQTSKTRRTSYEALANIYRKVWSRDELRPYRSLIYGKYLENKLKLFIAKTLRL